MVNRFFVDFIPGLVFGIEIFIGEDLADDDTFAMNINLGIVRLTFIRSHT